MFNRRGVISISTLLTSIAIGTAILVGSATAGPNGVESTEAGVTSWSTMQIGCLDARVDFDVNEYTYSVGLRHRIWDSMGLEKTNGWTTDVIANVTPGSTGNIYDVTGLDDGDSVLFGILTYNAPNGGGSQGHSPRAGPQAVYDQCVDE